MTNLENKLSEALNKKQIKFTKGQLTYVCNSSHEFTNGKNFNNWIMASRNIDLMIENFLKFRNLNKYESDFNIL